MKLAQVDYVPLSKIPSDTACKDQTCPFYSDGELVQNVRKGSGCYGYYPMAEFRLTGYRPASKFSHGNLARYAELKAARSYNRLKQDREFKNLVGRIVDTLA